jgi:HEAT repeat protein
MTERGYVRYRGRWRLPQEVKQLEAKRKQTAAENQWQANLKRWRAWLNDERAAEATARIRAINDPTAIKALTTQLPDEPSQNVRLLYVDALARIGTPEAVMALVDVSLLDPLEEVRLTAIDHLAEKKLPEVVAMYIKALRSKDNNVVNRAAVGLAHMENVAAIPPLIDALITTHEYAIVQGSPGISTSFGSVSGPGGTAPVSGLSVGQSTTYVAEQVRNAAVRDALIKLTGMNYDFDVATWKAWLASRRKAQSLDARRG